MKFRLLTILFIILFPLISSRDAVAQSDTIPLRKPHEQRISSPLKATMMAAAFPGLGQVYNRKYWKIPIVYAGFGALGYSIVFNTSNFNQYLQGYQDLTDDIPETNSYVDILQNTIYTPEQVDAALGSDLYDPQVGSWIEDQVRNAVDYYRRYRDLSYIGVAAWYMITIIDAHVDANLADFDVGEDLTLEFQPVAIRTQYGNGIGMGVIVTF
ncbi:MAG: DUF5683 domain-containing protein [Bacteroidales bacterium]